MSQFLACIILDLAPGDGMSVKDQAGNDLSIDTDGSFLKNGSTTGNHLATLRTLGTDSCALAIGRGKTDGNYWLWTGTGWRSPDQSALILAAIQATAQNPS